MKTKIFTLLLLAASVAFTGCKHDRYTNEENWEAVTLITENPETGIKDTIALKGDWNDFNTYTHTYFDKKFNKSILREYRIGKYGTAYTGKVLDDWYVIDNSTLYECTIPPYTEIDKGKYQKNDDCFLDGVKNTSDRQWIVIDENTAHLVRTGNDTKQTWVFKRDNSVETSK